MAPKAKPSTRAAAPIPMEQPYAGPWPVAPSTTQEYLQRIEAMGQRINGYIRFICGAGDLNGTSTEAREKAIAAFYERMVVLERQLGRVRDDLRLG